MRALVFALNADAAGPQAGRALARQAALRGKRVAAIDAAAYGGAKDASAAWGTGVLAVDAWSMASAQGHEESMEAEDLREAWEERTAIMVYDGHLPHTEAAGLAWTALSPRGDTP